MTCDVIRAAAVSASTLAVFASLAFAQAPQSPRPFLETHWEAPLIEAPEPVVQHGLPSESCATAQTIAALPFVSGFNNVGYSADGPGGACDPIAPPLMQNDAWFKWTANQTGDVLMDSTFMGYSGIVQVWSGATCGGLTSVLCARASGAIPTTVLSAIGGQTYWFQLGKQGFGPGGGDTDFALTALADNAICTRAIELQPFEVALGDTRLGSRSPSVPAFNCVPGAPTGFGTLWYSFIAPASNVVVSTFKTRLLLDPAVSTDTLLAVYDGQCGSLVQLACSDDASCCPVLPMASVELSGLTIGHEYFVQVAAKSQATSGLTRVELVVPLECPPGVLMEPEACGEDVNGGCNAIGNPRTPLPNNTVICGECWSVRIGAVWMRDTDWYSIEFPRETLVTIHAQSYADFECYLLTESCNNQQTLLSFGNFCFGCDSTVTQVLPAGHYAIAFVFPISSTFVQEPCESGYNRYLLRVEARSTCDGDANADGVVNFQDINAVIANWLMTCP